MAATTSTSTPILRLPPEIHLIILLFLPRVAQHELSLTCHIFRAIAGSVGKLSKEETIDLRLQQAAEGRGRHHLVCRLCARLLPFYFFAAFHPPFPSFDDRKRGSLCLPCREVSMRRMGLSFYRPRAVMWWFQEWIGVCPRCRCFVRCMRGDGPRFPEDAVQYMLNHGECLFPNRTTWEALEFVSNFGQATGDQLPMVKDKLALLTRHGEQFPTSLLGSLSDKPLGEFQGLFS